MIHPFHSPFHCFELNSERFLCEFVYMDMMKAFWMFLIMDFNIMSTRAFASFFKSSIIFLNLSKLSPGASF